MLSRVVLLPILSMLSVAQAETQMNCFVSKTTFEYVTVCKDYNGDHECITEQDVLHPVQSLANVSSTVVLRDGVAVSVQNQNQIQYVASLSQNNQNNGFSLSLTYQNQTARAALWNKSFHLSDSDVLTLELDGLQNHAVASQGDLKSLILNCSLK